jgi:transposase-like protein
LQWCTLESPSPRSLATSASGTACSSTGRIRWRRRSRRLSLEELRRIQKELEDVREELDILKEALAYFADDQK